MKNTYTATVTATYIGTVEVEAESAAEAHELMLQGIGSGELSCDLEFSGYNGVDTPEILEDDDDDDQDAQDDKQDDDQDDDTSRDYKNRLALAMTETNPVGLDSDDIAYAIDSASEVLLNLIEMNRREIEKLQKEVQRLASNQKFF